ncbi:MAG TPA: peptidylprolyl isomerase [Candidatus Saccharimonadia bacterium]|nr:peptidylprolyl isomerase [Candidatus Saccharimonadia bacterium]
MKASQNSVVSFHYTVVEASENVPVDSSRERGEPLAVLIGHGGLIPGVERALEGHEPGDRFEVEVAPRDAYGDYREGQTQRVPKKYFRDGDRLRPGMQTTLRSGEGTRVVTILKVGSSVIDIDLNHPLAGRTLKFDIEIVDVREASDEERAHGHVHGAGGHAH